MNDRLTKHCTGNLFHIPLLTNICPDVLCITYLMAPPGVGDPLHVPLMNLGDSAAAAIAGDALTDYSFDSDGFFTAIYRYWRRGGLRHIVLRHIADLIAALLLLFLLVVAWGVIDYDALRKHLQERRCPDGTLNDAGLFATDCYGLQPVDFNRLLQPPLGLTFVAAVCGALWLWAVVDLLRHIHNLLYVRVFMRNELHLCDNELHTIAWPDVEGRLLQTRRAQDMMPVGGGSRTISALHVVNCITRRANFAIDMYRADSPLALHLPGFGPFLPLSLQRALGAALDAVVYDRRGGIVPRRHNRDIVTRQLRRRLRRQALGQLALMPVLLVAHLAYLAFRHIHDFRARPAALLRRSWTSAARWRLRRYCELDHLLEARLRLAAPHADAYLRVTASPDVAIALELIQVVVGALIALLCILAFVFDEGFLLANFMPGRSVAFCLAVLGSIAAAVATSIHTPIDDVHISFNNLAQALGGDPPQAWHVAPAATETINEIKQCFRHVLISSLVEEVLGIVAAPILLGLILPARAGNIIDAFIRLRRSPPGLGDVCVHALLGGAEVTRGEGGQITNPRVLSSLMHFQRAHPAYTADAQQQSLIQSYHGGTAATLPLAPTEFSVVISD
jgi:hypothetical protein